MKYRLTKLSANGIISDHIFLSQTELFEHITSMYLYTKNYILLSVVMIPLVEK